MKAQKESQHFLYARSRPIWLQALISGTRERPVHRASAARGAAVMPTRPAPPYWQFALTAATTVREEKGPVGQFSVPAVWLARLPPSRPGKKKKTTNMNNSLAGARIRLALSLTHILHVWARGDEDEEEFR